MWPLLVSAVDVSQAGMLTAEGGAGAAHDTLCKVLTEVAHHVAYVGHECSIVSRLLSLCAIRAWT